MKLFRMLHQRKQHSLQKPSKARVWQATRKTLEMQDSAKTKKRRAKLLEKGSDKAQKTEAVDVEDDATSKKSSGKGKGAIWTSEPMPWRQQRVKKFEPSQPVAQKKDQRRKKQAQDQTKCQLTVAFVVTTVVPIT